MESSTAERVAELLERAEAAHGAYERDELGGNRDERWPEWYAAHLVAGGLGDLFAGPAPTVDQLAPLLTRLDETYRRERSTDPWPVAYARGIVAAFG